MSHLQYSPSALNVMHKFHRADVIIYVEGPDDIPFWDVIASKANIGKVKIKDSGGLEQLQDKINSILTHDTKIIVARDSDHSHYTGGETLHPRIITTFGYSIENTMYCPKTISRFISKLSRTLEDYSSDIIEWYGDFSEKTKILLLYDIANYIFGRGIQIMGNSCSRFLKNERSIHISESKINDFIDSIKDNFTEAEIQTISSMIDTDQRDIRWKVRGHFLSLGVINIIKYVVQSKKGSKISLSVEHLYTNTVDGCSICSPENCTSLLEMTSQFQNAMTTIN